MIGRAFKYKFFVICFFSLTHIVGVYGQTVTDDLIAMGKKFNGLKAYDMTVDMKVYSYGPNPKVTFSSTGRTIKSGDKFYMNVMNRKTIINNNIMLLVDGKQKLMMYRLITDEEMKKISAPQNINIDSLVKSQKTVAKYLVNNDVVKKVQIETGNDDIKTIIMSFHPTTYVINEIVYLYSEDVQKGTGNSKVIITYSNFSMECKSNELFNQSRYIKIDGKKVTAQEAYKKFKLIKPEGNKIE
ncbi:MAG: hypothetical protein C0448_14485 [Sphingobacteriaceae bacterium]|nr:hypothetical protein [Sphingobacteriaceae bacterium]